MFLEVLWAGMTIVRSSIHIPTYRYPGEYQTLNYAQTAEVAIGEHTHRKWIIKTTA